MNTLRKISLAELREIKEEGVSVVLAGIVVHFVCYFVNQLIGSIYTFGTWIVYWALANNQIQQTQLYLFVFPFLYLVANLTMPFSEFMISHYLLRLIIVASCLLISLTYFLISFQDDILWISIELVVLVGGFAGLMYLIPFMCANRYFPTSNNTLNVIFQGSQGIGVAILICYLHLGINPTNMQINNFRLASTDSSPLMVGPTIRIVSLLFLMSSLFIGIYLKYPKYLNTKLLLDYEIAASTYKKVEQTSQMQIRNTETERKEQETNPVPQPINYFAPTSECKSLLEGLFSKNFLDLFVMGSSTMTGFRIMSSAKLLSLSISGDDRAITIFLSLSFIAFGFARYPYRAAIQKMGFKKIFLLMAIFNALNTTLQSTTENIVVLGISIILGMFLQGGYFSWFSLYIPKVFGYRFAAKFIGIFLVLIGIHNFLIHAIHYLMSPVYALCITLIMLGISVTLTILYKQQKVWN